MTQHCRTRHKTLLSRIDEAEVVGLCRDLVQLKSVNPPGGELPVAEYAARTLTEVGLSTELVPLGPNRASLVARLRGSGELPALVYCGHLDVVPIGIETWQHDPFAAEVSQGKVWGRGSTDMKGGIAAMLVAARALALAKLPLLGDLVLLLTADEEVDQCGARSLATRPELATAQAVVICEPSYNRVYIAEKGQFWLKITTYGKAAHGSMPHLGQNAIMIMVALLNELEHLPVPCKEHPLLGGFTRSIGTIHGGVSTNIVPDRCEVTVDQRTVPGQDSGAVLRHMEALIDDLSRRIPAFRAKVEVTSDLPPVESSPNAPAVRSFCAAVAEVTGETPTPGGVPYATDAALLVAPLGVPMILCGPGNPDLAHQTDEYVEIPKLVESAKILTLSAARLLRA